MTFQRTLIKFFIYIIFFVCYILSVEGQEVKISGTVLDESGIGIIGAHVRIKNLTIGTITDADGNFTLISDVKIPFTMEISSVGMESQSIIIETQNNLGLELKLKESVYFGQEVVVSASRVEENILEISASIEKIGIADLQLTAAPNFYDELYKFKGVDMIVQSLTFRFPNSRGFNGNTNYRLNQIVDGVDNQSPGLSFAAGNIFGLSQLDVESVELLVGASSALYGPGGMNGTLIMTSKNPFDYQGLSFSSQTGIMHLGRSYSDKYQPLQDYNLRYAKAITDKFAIKVTGSYLSASDWHAADSRDKRSLKDNSNRWNNSAYDGVNIYGDEIAVSLSALEEEVAKGFVTAQFPDLVEGSSEYNDQINFIKDAIPDHDVTRTGWKEEDLVNYDTENIRIGTGLQYKINKNIKAIIQGNFGKGTAVYSAQNRFSINDFSIVNYKAELEGNNFFLRFFGVNENSGETYDAGGLAAFINENWKPSEEWYADYIEGFLTAKLGFALDDERAHKVARAQADNMDEFGNIPFPNQASIPQPQSDEFKRIKTEIRNTNLKDGGARVLDKSSMYQVEGMYNFSEEIESFEMLVGASLRYNIVNSEGTVFFDEPGNPFKIYQLGAYVQVRDEWATLKPTFSIRFDKNEYFKAKVTPRLSVVYKVNDSEDQYIRASAQTAFRFPAISDQWNDLVVGPLNVIGGQSVVQKNYNFDSNPLYPLDGNNPVFSKPIISEGEFFIPEFGPEKVTSFEVGFKGLYFGKKLWFDSYIYYNNYNGFLAQQLLAQNPNTVNEIRYQTTISLNQPVNAYGWSMGADYRLGRGFSYGANISYNGVNNQINDPGFQLQFNTPNYRYNVYLNNRTLTDKLGFSINYRWQNSFLWESTFGVGKIPSFATLDAQISYRLKQLKSILKLGGSNLLNNYYTTSFGSASVGGIYYISITFDQMNKF